MAIVDIVTFKNTGQLIKATANERLCSIEKMFGFVLSNNVCQQSVRVW